MTVLRNREIDPRPMLFAAPLIAVFIACAMFFFGFLVGIGCR